MWGGGCFFQPGEFAQGPFKVPWEQPGLARTPLTRLLSRPWGGAVAAGCLRPGEQQNTPAQSWRRGHTGVERGCPRPRDKFGRYCRRDGWRVGCGDFSPPPGPANQPPQKSPNGAGVQPCICELPFSAGITHTLDWQRGLAAARAGSPRRSPRAEVFGDQVPVGSRVRVGPHHRPPQNDENK